jgi:hypothetical protein
MAARAARGSRIPGAPSAWEARQVAAGRQLAQRGYDATTAAGWSADGMTDRANRYVDELAAGRWELPSFARSPRELVGRPAGLGGAAVV